VTNGPQIGNRAGSVGRLMPGMNARIVDPETGAERPPGVIGMVLLRGANVFPGYLGADAGNRTVFRDGWFVTGDLGRFDDDGFLFIEGRLARFSKIAGEMVPHGTVEQKIVAAFGWEDREAPAVFVAGVPDSGRGEALVLLTTEPVTANELRTRLLAQGVARLWIPRIVRRVDTIPFLGSGKMNLKRCRELVLDAVR